MESLWQQENFLLRQPDNFLDTHYTVYSTYFAIENKWGGGGSKKVHFIQYWKNNTVTS